MRALVLPPKKPTLKGYLLLYEKTSKTPPLKNTLLVQIQRLCFRTCFVLKSLKNLLFLFFSTKNKGTRTIRIKKRFLTEELSTIKRLTSSEQEDIKAEDLSNISWWYELDRSLSSSIRGINAVLSLKDQKKTKCHQTNPHHRQ